MSFISYKLGGDRPFPFVICSDDWACKRKGTTVVKGPDASPVIVDSAFPVVNVNDCSRQTFVEVTKLSGRTRGYLYLRYDLSASDLHGRGDRDSILQWKGVVRLDVPEG